MRSDRPVRFSSSGMPRLSSTGSTAWVQAPHSPMKTIQRLRLIGAPGVKRHGPEIPQQGWPQGGLISPAERNARSWCPVCR